MDFTAPYNSRPEGSNGEPISAYKVEVSSAANEVQVITLSTTSGADFTDGSFKLGFLDLQKHNLTKCIDLGASALTVEQYLEEVYDIDGVTVTSSNVGASSYTYNVAFDGARFSNGNETKIVVRTAEASCTAIAPTSFSSTVTTTTAGTEGGIFEVVEIVSSTDTGYLNGFVEISYDFEGEFTQVVTVAGIAELVTVARGSKTVSTATDLTNVVNIGDELVINGENWGIYANVQQGRTAQSS